jgi:hypothetical protein
MRIALPFLLEPMRQEQTNSIAAIAQYQIPLENPIAKVIAGEIGVQNRQHLVVPVFSGFSACELLPNSTFHILESSATQ